MVSNPFIRAVPVVAALAALVSCVGPATEKDRIVLERTGAGDGRWRATYLLGEPAGELRFRRQAGFYREAVWTIASPGWRLDRRGDDQTIVAGPDADRRRLVVEFPQHTDELAKEYEFFAEFSDGSVAVYTGHLYLTDEPPPRPGAEDDADFLVRVELRPRDDEQIVVRGRTARGRTVWDDPEGDGTYVYFGGIEPLETDAMIAVIDPGAPPWLRDELGRLLPEMFARYTTEFGSRLPWKPVVLFSFDGEGSGLSSGGGTLTGLVQMSARGSAWYDASPDAAEHLLYLIAHEAAHLWNGQFHPYRDDSDSWMHEGSADAFAELALLRSGTIDAARLAERRTEALGRCIDGLRGVSLRESGTSGRFDNYYGCGNVLALWSVAALGDAGEPDRLFDLWRAVFAHADDDGRYDRQSYFDALATLGVEAERVGELREFLDTVHADPAAAIRALLARAGLRLVPLDRPVPSRRRARATAAVAHLMRAACDGWYSFYTEWPSIRSATSESCEPFRAELRIVRLEGHGIADDGDRGYDAVAERCRAGLPVRLGLDGGGAVSVPCETVLPALLPPLAVPQL
ncbi:MAG TPA: hypothetical protein VD788_10810 [Candidatus Polarisedimenticolaceae bacterium]|nr:hypothetical protein [Candidatus Polarisedimenticolaceae bacterium]